MSGWICLHRSLLKHWLADEPEALAVWVRLLMEANHSSVKKLFNGKLIEIKRGQLVFGLPAFSAKSGVSIHKLRRVISALESDGMIHRQKTNKYSIISITCYEDYQSAAGKTQASNKQNAGKQQHYNNVNNENNVNKEELQPQPKAKTPPVSNDDLLFAEKMLNSILHNLPDFKRPNLNTWANVVRLMREQDNRNYTDMGKVFVWARKDSFWQGNILSAKKFREKYDTLNSQMIGSKNVQTNKREPIDNSAPAQVRRAREERDARRNAESERTIN